MSKPKPNLNTDMSAQKCADSEREEGGIGHYDWMRKLRWSQCTKTMQSSGVILDHITPRVAGPFAAAALAHARHYKAKKTPQANRKANTRETSHKQ
jgi:hypothetical protein